MTPEESQEVSDARPKWSNEEIRPFKDLESFLAISGVLQGETAKASLEARKRFLALLMFPEFHVMTNQEKADAVGVSPQTIAKWLIQCPDEYLAEALKVSRERHARQSFEVDTALMRQCKEGNVKAMDLYYRRIEGWVPKQDMELSRGRDRELDGKANFDLLKELVKGLSPEERRQLIGDVPGGAIEGNVERLEGTGEGGGGGE